MRKTILIIFILTIFVNVATAQNYRFGLFANSYLQPIGNSDKVLRIKKPIFIIYNKDYCTFYVEGKGSVFFKTRDYKVGTEGEYIHTDFVSEETNTTPDGYYGIMIDKSKNETIFQVNLPNGFTYIVDKAVSYSENGLVKNNPYIKRYKEFDSTIIAKNAKQ